MVNTVGSCENKHWQKRWITIKKSLVLTTKQRSLIIGSLLGDGTLRQGYRMYFNQEETKKLVKITYPYISRIPSMTYKVGIHNPVTTGFLPFAKKAG